METLLKGKLAIRHDKIVLNISQIRTITTFNYTSDPPVDFVIIETTFDKRFHLSNETREALLARIATIRESQGPNGLLEITVKPYKINNAANTSI